ILEGRDHFLRGAVAQREGLLRDHAAAVQILVVVLVVERRHRIAAGRNILERCLDTALGSRNHLMIWAAVLAEILVAKPDYDGPFAALDVIYDHLDLGNRRRLGRRLVLFFRLRCSSELRALTRRRGRWGGSSSCAGLHFGRTGRERTE